MSSGTPRTRLRLQPDVLRWARKRARFSITQLAGAMAVAPERVSEWERTGVMNPVGIEVLSSKTRTPFGLLYLSRPPEDGLPIPDYRTRDGDSVDLASPELMEVIGDMLRRQAWMRDELADSEMAPVTFVASHTLTDTPRAIARTIREALGLGDGWAAATASWREAFEKLRDHTEGAGVLVTFNGVIGNDAGRALDPDEFQGFALCDPYAPLVFVNGADFEAAQMFTLAHELAHLALGLSGVSGCEQFQTGHLENERLCDRAAAELLVPETDFRKYWPQVAARDDPLRSVAQHFRVSPIVSARRALDLGYIGGDRFWACYRECRSSAKVAPAATDGDDFWNTQRWRIGLRFAEAVVRAVREERLLYRDAYLLTDLYGDTFDLLPKRLAPGA